MGAPKLPESALSPVVSEQDWQAAIAAHRVKEKAATDARDALAAERRRLPMTRIDKPYTFDGADGKATLADLFEGRRQLVLYHFMYAPGVGGWPDAGCPGCSLFIDQVSHLSHLNARDTSFCAVSLGPWEKLQAYQKRMEWDIAWYSSAGTSFNRDMGVTTDKGEDHALSIFFRDGDAIYRTYWTTARGCETLGPVWTLLDLTPLGRQEKWEDTPAGRPQTEPFTWWRRHDEY
jgi:predicted dithiol-disulfide oxidoreductase (DUF899 family)